jgi:hypothetical protein
MEPRWLKRNTLVLWGMVLLGVIYMVLLGYLPRLTGSRTLDGILGVLLGLYIASHPAANTVELLFFRRGVLHQISSEWPGLGWLALNLLVLAVGYVVIVNGATRLIG